VTAATRDRAPRTSRLAIEPLITQLQLDAASRGEVFSSERACEDAGIHHRSWYRWIQSGTLPVEAADALACKVLNVPPAFIWPEWPDLPFHMTRKQRYAARKKAS
jgi:hypothetical protein